MYDVSLKRKWDAASIRESALLEREKAKELGREEGREEGRKEGIEKGIEQGKQEVVENLLSTGKFTITEIANFASVSEDFVKKVQDSMKFKKK